ncbi:type IV toxin-antitoxin system AbiEi family antitoxin [uncultured Fibrella sp.]|uniref:type IV toxin-antitoxin system AbiEi family antitoxin n=1 Tax=uncultured Fibrella sp. TaxID=1284596 RepID=UPI0035CC0D70
MAEQLLQTGLNVLSELLPNSVINATPTPLDKQLYDTDVTIQLGKKTVTLAVELKISAQRLVMGQLQQQLSGAVNPTLLTDYVNPILSEKLRANGINYIDTAGNTYLRIDGLGSPFLVWIEGRKPVKRAEEKADHAFTKAGLRVTYWLLTHPDQINEPMRTIAQQAGASLETVHRAKSSLQQRGFIMEIRKKEWALVNRKTLIDKWIEAYATRLKPSLLIRRYRQLKSASTNDWTTKLLDTPMTQWGGEPAADGLTGLLRPAEWTIYTRQSAKEVADQLRLLPDPEQGPIQVYEKFWPQDEPGTFVNPLLVYADLLTSQDPRNGEVAQKLYESHVQRLLD